MVRGLCVQTITFPKGARITVLNATDGLWWHGQLPEVSHSASRVDMACRFDPRATGL